MKLPPEVAREVAPGGTLRAALNLGNPVLARSRTSAAWPAGVSVDLARAFAHSADAHIEFLEFDTPGESAAAIAVGEADIGFLAIDPQRAESIHFTQPYVEIEGAYAVRAESLVHSIDEVDAPGTRIVAGVRSAYALFLARTLRHATLLEVPTSEEVVHDLLCHPEAQVAAGVRQQLEADARRLGGVRLLPGRFMVIRQAMAMPRGRSAQARQALEDFLAQQRRSGFVAQALERHGIEGATALP